jgi:hypothetical protein
VQPDLASRSRLPRPAPIAVARGRRHLREPKVRAPRGLIREALREQEQVSETVTDQLASGELPASNTHRAARWYAKHGRRVHPLRPRTKLPIFQKWQNRATTDVATVDAWWGQYPESNIGVATGVASGVVVIDIDPRHAGNDSIAELEAQHGGLPDTWRAQTAHAGEHIWFDPASVVVRNSAGKLGAGLDVRGEGGYVVAPPSVLEGGGGYVWLAGYGPHELALAPMPQWLVALLQGTTSHDGAGDQRVAASEWSDLLIGGIPAGRIQTTLWRVAAHLGGKNVAPPVLYACVYALGVVTGLEQRRVLDIIKRVVTRPEDE